MSVIRILTSSAGVFENDRTGGGRIVAVTAARVECIRHVLVEQKTQTEDLRVGRARASGAIAGAVRLLATWRWRTGERGAGQRAEWAASGRNNFPALARIG